MESPISVWIDEDIAELIPGYMGRRREDLAELSASLEHGEFDRITGIGHSLKGSGGGYGFTGISEIGRNLEQYASLRDEVRVKECVELLEHYLNTVEISVKPCGR
ncbi:Hpt domain-containing protein [Paenibacillus ihuae]|uniref:Hpt domain-containing protein n=1 Tax=Paenibacillus ihuae TaxID=1232431 RepID=UPI0006D5861D|nr:Hpt domain-containing protein [Paenibacillus ihuae]